MKKTAQKVYSHKHVSVSLVVLAVALILSAILTTVKLKDYVQSNEAIGVISLRENILMANKNLHKRAPVDPKTGDIYFPDAKLFVAQNSMLADLTYSYEQNGFNGEEISISTEAVFNKMSAELYLAQNTQELLGGMPKLQSCQRGIRLTQSKIENANNEGSYNEIVALPSGKQYYMFVEASCQELFSVAAALKNIQTY
jgi:hypothetical protein